MPLEASQKLVLAFVTLMLGVVFVSVIATNVLAVTDRTIVIDESNDLTTSCIVATADGGDINESNSACNITVTNAPTGWQTIDCPLVEVVVGNSTSDFTLSTDYNLFASSGVVQMLNSTQTLNGSANTTLVDYNYCADDYMNLTWGRTLLLLIAGFFAIALLMVSVGLFFSIAKDYGIV